MGERRIHFINMALNLFLYPSHEINYGGDEMGGKNSVVLNCNEYYRSCFLNQFTSQR